LATVLWLVVIVGRVFVRLIRESLCAIAEVAAIALNTRAIRSSLVVFIVFAPVD
jgi:hypothetical protein